MSRFQSYLFNWIKRSFAVELGRKARRAVERITHDLMENFTEKIAKIVTENEPTLAKNPTIIRKLLNPVYSLVKRIVKPSPITQNQPQTDSLQVLEEPPTLALRNKPTHSKSTQSKSKISLEELVAQALVYFSSKKRTLATSKDDRLAIYHEIADDQSSANLIKVQSPVPMISTIINEPSQSIETWESEIDNYSMRAWIETQAISLGYADSPIIKVLLWLDKLIAKIERWFISIWQTIVEWYRSKFTDRG